MKQSLTIEDLEQVLDIPSFETELALSDLPHVYMFSSSKVARYVACPKCGIRTLVGPLDTFSCPNSPHDPEDDTTCVDAFIEELELNTNNN